MAKIGKIRIINFVYNENRHIYDQTYDFGKGEDALLNLQNGGGKTVLVQMMMQPMVPKLKLKDRVFKSYFANSKAPCYIMIEWIPDGRAERVLTGIGVKRVSGKNTEEESDSLKVITFLSEYEEGSRFDIKNMELLEEERGAVRLIEFDKVIRNLSAAEKEGEKIWLYRWELPDDKREYNRRLLQYKINPLEWKNLMVKINESEAGLNSFFNDCKTGNALIKKWFLPTIEEQLNKNGNFIENIKELIKNHAIQRVKNEAMMKEREVFERFRTKSAGLVKKLEEQEELLKVSSGYKAELGSAWNGISSRLSSLGEAGEELVRKIKQAEGDFNSLEYERMSGEYHVTAGALEELRLRQEELEREIEKQEESAKGLEHKRRLLSGLLYREELKEFNGKIAGFETELEKENLKQEDQKDIISEISYSLKEIYKEREKRSEEQLLLEERCLKEARGRRSDSGDKRKALKEEADYLQKELVAVLSRIAVFKERKKELMTAYPDLDLACFSQGEEYSVHGLPAIKESFLTEEKEYRIGIEEQEKQTEALRKLLKEAEREKKERSEKQQALAVEQSRAENARLVFEEKKRDMEKLLRAYQIGGESLYDRDRTARLLHGEAEKYNRLIQDTALENSVLRKQLKQYESGNVLELPEGLVKILEDNGVFVEYGYEWLKSLEEERREKLKLVKNNPFLPASLIVSGKDMDKIKKLEFEGTLPSLIPVLEREKLKEILAVKSGKNVYRIGETEFLITYDDKLLNKNYLREVMEEITRKISKNDETLASAEEALKNTELAILRAESFSYTEEEAGRFSEALKEAEEALRSNEERLSEIQRHMEELEKRISESDKESRRLEDMQSAFCRKKEEILGFLARGEELKVNLEKKKRLEEKERDCLNRIREAEENMEKAGEEIREREGFLMNFKAELEENRRLYLKYRDAKPAKRLYEDPEKLEARLKVLVSDTDGKIRNLHEILKDYRHRREEKNREIADLGLMEEEFAGKEYREFEMEEVLKRQKVSEEIRADLKEERDSVRISAAEKSSDLKYAGRMIKDKCGYETPMPVEAVRNLDFGREKKAIKDRLKALEKEVSVIKTREGELEKSLFPLEEFREFAEKDRDDFTVPDNLKEWVLGRIREHKEAEERIRSGKEKLAALYLELETEFAGKSDMFKALFRSILEGEKRYQPLLAGNAFDRVYLQIDRKLEQHSIDLRKIDDMESGIVDNTLSYLKNVYDEMNGMDKNSVIEIDGRRCKMLLIELPEKETLDTLALKEYLKGSIQKCEALYKQEKSPENLLLNEINTYALFDRLAGMNKIHINLMKIEPNRLKKKSWKQVIEETSGGEKFVSAFVVFISLLTYMRGDVMPGDAAQSKVLIMDNPFGPITSEHLLKPLFEISKKYNTQMICLSDLKEHTIYDRFNLIYSLSIEREVGRDEEYIEQKTVKKDIGGDEEEMVSAALFQIDDLSRFERVN